MATINNTTPNTIISGTSDADSIVNSVATVTIDSGAGNDFIGNGGDSVTIDAGDDDDRVNNGGNSVTIDTGTGNDSIWNYGSSVTIDAGTGADGIYNNGATVTIDAGTGDNTIKNAGVSVMINAGEGIDSITNRGSGSLVTVSAGAGSDYIRNDGSSVTIDAGDSADEIYNNGATVTIDAGTGNDSIWNYGSSVTIDAGTGDDYIRNDGATVTINASAGDDNILNEAESVAIDASDGNDSIWNYGSSVTIDASNGVDTIKNEEDYVTINAGAGNDYIRNGDSGSLTAIDAGDGNDRIYNRASSVTIDAGNGADTILNGDYSASDSGSLTAIYAGDGDDSISNDGSNVTINAGAGNDSISNGKYGYQHSGSLSVIDAGEGDDNILNEAESVTIDAGIGNDLISLRGGSALIVYNDGDGNDTVYGYNAYTATLDIADGLSTTSVQSGSDIIINVEGSSSGSITLVDVVDSDTTVDPTVDNITTDDTTSDDTTVDGTPSSSEDNTDADDTVINARVDLSTVLNDSVGSFVINPSSTHDGDFYTANFSDALHYNGHRYQIFVKESLSAVDTWEEAEVYAESLGGYLAIINDDDENSTLYSYMISQGYRDAYFGLSDATSEGYWYWVDGTPLVDNLDNKHWGTYSDGTREPNNGTLENYAMYYRKTPEEQWNDGDFNYDDGNSNFIVEWDADNDTVVGSVTSDRVYSAVGDLGRQAITVDNNWFVAASALDDEIIITGDGSSIDAAEGNDVISINGGSARIVYTDGDGNDTIYGFDSDTVTLAIAEGLSTTSIQSGTDMIINVEGDSVGSLTLKNVYADVGSINAAVDLSIVRSGKTGSFFVTSSDTLSDGNAYHTALFQADGSVNIPADAVTYNNHSYYVFNDVNTDWYSAEDFAESIGGNLVIITSEGEQNVVQGMLESLDESVAKNNYWMGATIESTGEIDGVKQYNYRWVDGTPVDGNSYTHWQQYGRPQPDGDSGSIMMYYAVNPYATNSRGDWNDFSSSGVNGESFFGVENFGAIVEWNNEPSTVVGTVSSDHVYSAVSDIGKQSITVASDWLVTASDLDDSILITGDASTVEPGNGNDVISINGGSARIEYKDGNGDDTIYGFSLDTSTLQFAEGLSTESATIGNDVVITATGDSVGSITLKNVVEPSTVTNKIDLVYIVDTSGSMDQYINKIRNTAAIFGDYLTERNVEFRLGLVEYDTRESIRKYDFTSDINTFIGNVDYVLGNSFEDNQGAEYGLSAITDPDNGALSLNFDSDADKYFVVITDEGYWDNNSDSETVIASLQAADIQLDVIGRLRSKARYIPGYGYHMEDLDCQPEWEPIATSTGGEFYDIDGDYNRGLQKIVSPTTDGKTVVINLSLADSSTSGCFVLDDDSSRTAAFKTETVEGDTIVGFVNGDHIYEAADDSARQEIRVTSDWNVTATDKKDEIKIYGSGTTITGGGEKDYITINNGVSTVTLADLDVAEDDLTFVSDITPGELDSSVANGQLGFSSTVLSFDMSDQSALTSDIKNYTVHNGDNEHTIADLLYGTDTHRVSLSFVNYGANPRRTYVTNLADVDEGFFELTDGDGSRSVWGGNDGDDTLTGTDGYDEFFYLKTNGNDVIENAGDNDLINLLNISLEEIDLESFPYAIGDDATTIKFNDGGSIKVNGTSEVGFKVANVDCTFCVKDRQWAIK